MRGHVHGARYGSTRLDDDPELLRAYRYVARNPVEANLCNSPTNWPWSSYASAVGFAEPHSFVDASMILGCFNGARDEAAAALRKFVEEA